MGETKNAAGPDTVTPTECRRTLLFGRELALLDVREEAAYGAGHPLFAAHLPLSRLELLAPRALPRRNVEIVLYDDGEGLVARSAEILTALGYSRVRALAGGLTAWRAAGLEVFTDLNSPSKAFGELMAETCGTPEIEATVLRALMEAGHDLVVVDSRPFEEYRAMNIPGALNVPGGDLVLRAREAAPDPKTLIVVNCAGRTRGLIGAQSLINAGVENRVVTLKDGTIGWELAGLDLEHRQSRQLNTAAPHDEDARARARALAYGCGVRRLTPADLAVLAADGTRTLYRFDLRDRAEHRIAPPSGFTHAPGGQLIQETDLFAPVRGARIVLWDDRGVRADMAASWLAQMGWEVYVLDGHPETAPARPPEFAPPLAPSVTVEALSARLGEPGLVIVDLASSFEHAKAHIPGARFALRARFGSDVLPTCRGKDIVLTSSDGRQAQWAWSELAAAHEGEVLVLERGTEAWRLAGGPLESGLDQRLSEPDDVYRRPFQDIDPVAAKRAYIAWEHGLVAQLARDATHGFSPRIAPGPASS